MKISASWSLELTKLVVMHPDAIFSLIKWQSTSMCLVLSCLRTFILNTSTLLRVLLGVWNTMEWVQGQGLDCKDDDSDGLIW